MKTPNDVEITSWTHLIEQLYLDSWQDDIKRYRSNFAFRGLSNKAYELKTSLIRLGGKYYELERHLIRNFIKYARLPQTTHFSIWNWLVIAQHHGLPTRLLDWTFSPFVAIHFATSNVDHYSDDGVIWCVDYVQIHDYLPDIFKNELQKAGANGFTVEMLSKICNSLEVFDNIADKEIVLFFDPPSMDDRIVNQFALHSVVSNPTIKLNDILMEYPKLYKRVIIPSKLKWEIRDKLDQSNINERVMFPGLDGLSKWLTRHYSPR